MLVGNAQALLSSLGLALEQDLRALLHNVGDAQDNAVSTLLGGVGAHGLANLVDHAERAALVDGLVLADEQLLASGLEHLDVVADHLGCGEGSGRTGKEYLHAKLDRVDAHLLAELGGNGAVDIGGGGALEHERVGHHGREQ